MYEITIYTDRHGYSQIQNYLDDLERIPSKNSRIKLKQFNVCVQYLKSFGTRAGMPKVRHVRGEIWELRPGRDRVLFAAWIDNKFVLLHQFLKTTQETPQSEIEQAERELADWKERFL